MSRVDELEAQVAELKARLAKHEDERVASAELLLSLEKGLFIPPVWAPYRNGMLGGIETKESTAKSSATRWGRGDDGTIIEFRLTPIALTEKVEGKWPKKPRKRKAKK